MWSLSNVSDDANITGIGLQSEAPVLQEKDGELWKQSQISPKHKMIPEKASGHTQDTDFLCVYN